MGKPKKQETIPQLRMVATPFDLKFIVFILLFFCSSIQRTTTITITATTNTKTKQII